ncbi:MAG: hypothetical protein PHV32_02725 [Eubacteriales bacterium]|nr:hypothetical protein [Eubacteriales bacterium]
MTGLKKTLIFPDKVYKKLTGKIFSLVLGMIAVGLFDITPFLMDNFKGLFRSADSGATTHNVLTAAGILIALGVLDVLLFAVPLYDLFKVFKKEGPMEYTGELRVRLFKVYIIAHLPVLPLQLLIYYFTRGMVVENANIFVLFILSIVSLLLALWFYMLISRGVNSLYDFKPLQKRLVFPVVLIWSYILGTVMDYAMSAWIIKLFRM